MTETQCVVLDACVLANFSLCDTLLRLAEPPRLFEPRWSEEIILETTRTLETKLGWPRPLCIHFEGELRRNFGEAWISGHEILIPQMANDEKDRHVLAAAVHGESPIIVTFNTRHFGRVHLERWGVTAMHPQSFLTGLFEQEPALILNKLAQQARDRGRSLSQLLTILSATVPDLVGFVSRAIAK